MLKEKEKRNNIIVRVFGSNVCMKCNFFLNELDMVGIKYVYVDALHQNNQLLCDRYNIDELPHTQVLDDDYNIIKEYIGDISISTLYNEIERLTYDAI